jgi:hypothetical protein
MLHLVREDQADNVSENVLHIFVSYNDFVDQRA